MRGSRSGFIVAAGVVACLGLHASAKADPIVVSSGPASADEGQAVVLSWTQTGTFNNVSITAQAVDQNSSPSAAFSVFLTNQIGPDATVANQIDSAQISVPEEVGIVTFSLFSNLTLGAGTYFLVIDPTGGNILPVETFTGFTTGTGISNVTNSATATIDSDFAPASTFGETLNKGGNLLVSITGDAAGSSVPEPATLTVLGLGLAGLTAVRRRV